MVAVQRYCDRNAIAITEVTFIHELVRISSVVVHQARRQAVQRTSCSGDHHVSPREIEQLEQLELLRFAVETSKAQLVEAFRAYADALAQLASLEMGELERRNPGDAGSACLR